MAINRNREAINLAKTLKKTLSQLERVKNDALSNLNEDQRKQIAPISADFSRVIEAAKKGDTTQLNEMISKYANINWFDPLYWYIRQRNAVLRFQCGR